MIDVLLGVGSNLGDSKALVDEAVARLDGLPGARIVARSSYYKTEPVGPIRQEWFINIAVKLRTEAEADSLSVACREIEAVLGRDRSIEVPSGPRLIDIDLLAVSRADADMFALRQQRIVELAFVLIPLAEIAPNARLGTRRVVEHLSSIDQSGVERLGWLIPNANAGMAGRGRR